MYSLFLYIIYCFNVFTTCCIYIKHVLCPETHIAKYKYLLFFKCNTNENTFVPRDYFCKEIICFYLLFVKYLLNSELLMQQSVISNYENFIQVFIILCISDCVLTWREILDFFKVLRGLLDIYGHGLNMFIWLLCFF